MTCVSFLGKHFATIFLDLRASYSWCRGGKGPKLGSCLVVILLLGEVFVFFLAAAVRTILRALAPLLDNVSLTSGYCRVDHMRS